MTVVRQILVVGLSLLGFGGSIWFWLHCAAPELDHSGDPMAGGG